MKFHHCTIAGALDIEQAETAPPFFMRIDSDMLRAMDLRERVTDEWSRGALREPDFERGPWLVAPDEILRARSSASEINEDRGMGRPSPS